MNASKNNNERLLIYTFPFFLVIFTYSQLKGFNMLFARTWIWLFMAVVIAYNYLKPYFAGKAIQWTVFYAVILIFNVVSGDPYYSSIPNVLLEVFVIFLCILLSKYICILKNKLFLSIIVFLTLAIVIVTSVLTISVIQIMPGVVRQVVVTLNHEGGELLVLDLYRLGVCEYPFPHALPILIPPLIFWILNPSHKMMKPVATFLLALIFYFLYMCDVGTPLFVAVFLLVASLIMSKTSVKTSLIRVSILLLLFAPFFNKGIMVDSLSMVEDRIEEDNLIKKKVTDMRLSIQYGEAEGAADDRQTLYDKSVDGFLKSPLWGTNDKRYIGGHSVLLDHFSTLGLLGAIPFFLIIFYHFKFIFDHLPDNVKSFYIVSILGFILMLAIKNMNNIYTWLYVSIIAPCFLLYACDTKSIKKLSRKNA